MNKGLFLDPRAWKIDFQASKFWNPDKYGVHIDLHPDAFKIPKTGITGNYQFVITTEVWEAPMRKTLKYLRNKGLKVFLVAREPIKYGELIDAMFQYERFNINGEYYFTPDAVFAAGQKYADLWKDKTKTHITGYPRWDWYIGDVPTKESVYTKNKLDINKKTIFFPSYPPYHYKKQKDGKDTLIDLFSAREQTLEATSEFAKAHPQYQFVAKIHPMSMKCYLKKTGMGNEVSGLLEQYYKKPTEYFRVIGDKRMSGDDSKELLLYSDIIVGYNSTMLLEAAILDKPVVQVTLGNSNQVSSPYYKVFKQATTKKELLDLLERCIISSDQFITTEAKVTAKDYMYDVDGKACERICEAIKQELK